jgi:hypothetical protein
VATSYRKVTINCFGLSLILRPTVSRPVCPGIKHPSGTYDHIFITVRQLRVRWYRALYLTRGRVCRLQLLLALASAVIFVSESLGTCDHILLSQIRDFPFRRLPRLAGLRWRYSTPPPHGTGGLVCYALTHKFEADRIQNIAQQAFEKVVICVLHWSKPVYQMYIFVSLISLSLMIILWT